MVLLHQTVKALKLKLLLFLFLQTSLAVLLASLHGVVHEVVKPELFVGRVAQRLFVLDKGLAYSRQGIVIRILHVSSPDPRLQLLLFLNFVQF